MQKMNIVYKRLDELRPYENNAKTHPESQLANIAHSIENYGWKCTIAARTCLNVINPAQINALECADIFKSAYMYAPVFGYCAPRAPRFLKGKRMEAKLIKNTIWIICPRCGQKLHPIRADAVCHGVGTTCKKCGWSGEIDIEDMTELKGAQKWQASRSMRRERERTTK